ncbi:MAG: hypothetical protein QM767_03725 [Anaeromyxobacter sp.]
MPKKNLAPVALPSAPRVFVLGSIQSVVIVRPGRAAARQPGRDPETALNTILGGVFISRLNINLREDKHWS